VLPGVGGQLAFFLAKAPELTEQRVDAALELGWVDPPQGAFHFGTCIEAEGTTFEEPLVGRAGFVVAGQTIDLGEGMLPQFSPDGSKVAWAAGEACDWDFSGPFEVRVMDLPTRETRVVASGDRVAWASNDELVFAEQGTNDWVRLNLVTGEETPQGNPWRDDHQLRMAEKYGYYFERGAIRDGESGQVIAWPESRALVLLDRERVILATPVTHADQRTNLFLLDLNTLQAEFLVSAHSSRGNWPLTAQGSKVMWVPHYCLFVD
jgi:hypothetical protein